MNLKTIHSIYFVGIGGIGMSALARHFLHQKCTVYGYDKYPSTLCNQLTDEGAQIQYDASTTNLPTVDLVVYTPAVSKTHPIIQHYDQLEVPIAKRSWVLGMLSKSALTIAIAGSHGKTSVTTLLAHILNSSGQQAMCFLGGISVNHNTNYLPGQPNLMLVEADEFDRSFLQLYPYYTLITAVDSDHLDVYGSMENIQNAFAEFASKTYETGHIITHQSVQIPAIDSDIPLLHYSAESNTSDYNIIECSDFNEGYHFTASLSGKKVDFQLSIPGKHNVENALAAISIAHLLNTPIAQIQQALASYKGVKRRMELLVNTSTVTYIDDYAHHPQEIITVLNSTRAIYSNRKITAVFQPHLFTRTRDYANEFAAALDIADEVVVLDIYPARELPIEGVSSSLIFDQLTNTNKHLINKTELVDFVAQREMDVLLTIGAGDIGTLVTEIAETIKLQLKK